MQSKPFHFLFLAFLLFSSSIVFSQSHKVVGRYKLCKNIPKETFETSKDSVTESATWEGDQFIRLKRNKQAELRVVHCDGTQQISFATWIQSNDTITLTVMLKGIAINSLYELVEMNGKTHLKSKSSMNRYYEKE